MSYTIAGVKVLNEYIAMATLGAYGALGYSLAGGSKDAKPSTGGSGASSSSDPPLNAANSDEEAFIKQFLAEAEKDGDSARQV